MDLSAFALDTTTARHIDCIPRNPLAARRAAPDCYCRPRKNTQDGHQYLW
jgi:hypothetical protein